MKAVKKYWGYGLLLLTLGLWTSRSIGPVAIVAMSAASTAYFLFQAPVWCGATTRSNQLCRKNAKGVLFGCSYRQHKYQKLKMAVVPSLWRRLNTGLWTSPTTGIATIGALLGIISTGLGLLK